MTFGSSATSLSHLLLVVPTLLLSATDVWAVGLQLRGSVRPPALHRAHMRDNHLLRL